MKIELTEVELEIIKCWYGAAVGESYADQSTETFDLLDKLGIRAEDDHLYAPNPDHVIDSYRPTILKQIEAIRAYRTRHPEIVIE